MIKHFVIIDKAELIDENSTIDFSQLPYDNYNRARHSIDGTQVVIKYLGNKPSFFEGKTIYAYSQISAILKEDHWSDNTDPRS
jgi:hypothetical protein|tara:strand:+ start:2193 stop:2441 length:249 start_codon:yes stop_codon:yes gene_type:complete